MTYDQNWTKNVVLRMEIGARPPANTDKLMRPQPPCNNSFGMEPDMAIDEGCWTSINAPSWRDLETRSDKNFPGIMKICIPRSFFAGYHVCFRVGFEAFHLQRNILPCKHDLFIRKVPFSSFLPKTNREMESTNSRFSTRFFNPPPPLSLKPPLVFARSGDG